MFIKLSLCAFYLRLSINERFGLAVKIIGCICVGYTVPSIIAVSFSCIPLSKQWNPNELGSCINVEAFVLTHGSLSLATDVVIFILPLRPLWKMRLPRRERIALLFLLALGAL